MKVINFLDVHPCEIEISELQNHSTEKIPITDLLNFMVTAILRQYPWENRQDLIPMYHPAETYANGDWIALPGADQRYSIRNIWKISKIREVISASNPHQGDFQILVFESRGVTARAAGLGGAHYLLPDYSSMDEPAIHFLTKKIVVNYLDHLKKPIAKLINTGILDGSIVGEYFIPNNVDGFLVEFIKNKLSSISSKNPWLSTVELANEITEQYNPKISNERLIEMIANALDNHNLIDLGNGFWTTQRILDNKSRNIPQGVPAPHIHNVINIWTEDDVKESALIKEVTLPKELYESIDEEEGFITEPQEQPWQPPEHSLRLPTLSYLHITQAYFPVGKILQAFQPDARLIHVKILNGEYQEFLLNRESGHLIAVDKYAFFNAFKEGPPAGSYLWLEHESESRYRVKARKLRNPRPVLCKLVYLRSRKLIVENSEMLMEYYGNPNLFKADLRFKDIEAFFREARQSNLSVRDAIIQSIQELAENDPDGAHVSDIFNLVFLKRMCSPRFVSYLLYTQPCFKQKGRGYFQYIPLSRPVIENVTTERQVEIAKSQGPVLEKTPKEDVESPDGRSEPKSGEKTSPSREIPIEEVIEKSAQPINHREVEPEFTAIDINIEAPNPSNPRDEKVEIKEGNWFNNQENKIENIEQPNEQAKEQVVLENLGLFKKVLIQTVQLLKRLIHLFNRGE